MDAILANIAVWGLGFALLNLFITVDKNLRDPDKPMPVKIAVIVGGLILLFYAVGIGGFALGLLFGGAETAVMG